MLASITGYRAWLADSEGRLRSLASPDIWWRPGTQPAAVCHKPLHGFHEAHLGPAPHAANHPCGYHAYHTLGALLASGAHDVAGDADADRLTLVRGIVAGGGRTHEHDFGWRAQYAMPVAIIRFAPADLEARSRALLASYAAAERYGIPLIDPKEA
jgi:hypothetical protein